MPIASATEPSRPTTATRTERLLYALAWALGISATHAACSAESDASLCGPGVGTVARVVDGDTIDLESGERVRYLLVNAPEVGSGECWAAEAMAFNAQLVEGRSVSLAYDGECTDRYDRLLAYVSVDERNVNALLVERGYACVLYLPPSGSARVDAFFALEATARSKALGMWGACAKVSCG